MRRIVVVFLAGVLLLMSPAGARAEVTGPIRVIDGDTLDVGGTRVRLFGIDAPEQDQTCDTGQGKQWPCGAWVSETVRAQYEGQWARCERRDIDRYGRVVARCLVRNRDMGQMMVQAGLAFAYRKYAMDYDPDERRAAAGRLGLHAGQMQLPSEFRQTRGSASGPDPACRIKGNVSAKGARIYHLPGQRDYARTRISTQKGERWFCSEAEARTAGWRVAKR
jgi:endonuclease YncB( thermonuclease family)